MTAAAESSHVVRDVEVEEHVLRMLSQADPTNLRLRAQWKAVQKAVRDRAFRSRYFEACEEPEFIRDARERGVDPIRAARGSLGGSMGGRKPKQAAKKQSKSNGKPREEAPAAQPKPPEPTSPESPPTQSSLAPEVALRIALDALMESTEERRSELAEIMKRLEDLPEEVDQLEIASNRVAALLGEPPPFTSWRQFAAEPAQPGSQN